MIHYLQVQSDFHYQFKYRDNQIIVQSSIGAHREYCSIYVEHVMQFIRGLVEVLVKYFDAKETIDMYKSTFHGFAGSKASPETFTDEPFKVDVYKFEKSMLVLVNYTSSGRIV